MVVVMRGQIRPVMRASLSMVVMKPISGLITTIRRLQRHTRRRSLVITTIVRLERVI